MTKLQKYQQIYLKKEGEKDKTEKDITKFSNDLKMYKKDLERKEKALAIIKLAALNTQKQLEMKISSIVSMALAAVFDDPYDFKIDFVERRGRTECDLWFIRDNNLVAPFTASGLGACDIAGFALRILSVSMDKNLRKIIILDEPFKHLKGEKENQKAIQMMKAISKELDIQIITISDERAVIGDIISGADKIFKVTQKNKISEVQEL
jgi:hypothetical protein